MVLKLFYNDKNKLHYLVVEDEICLNCGKPIMDTKVCYVHITHTRNSILRGVFCFNCAFKIKLNAIPETSQIIKCVVCDEKPHGAIPFIVSSMGLINGELRDCPDIINNCKYSGKEDYTFNLEHEKRNRIPIDECYKIMENIRSEQDIDIDLLNSEIVKPKRIEDKRL